MAERRPLGALGSLIQRDLMDKQKFAPPSYRDLAKRMDVTPSAFGNWMAGQSMPSPENLRELARVTELSYDRLLDAALIDARYRESIDYVRGRSKGGDVNEVRAVETGPLSPSPEVDPPGTRGQRPRGSGR